MNLHNILPESATPVSLNTLAKFRLRPFYLCQGDTIFVQTVPKVAVDKTPSGKPVVLLEVKLNGTFRYLPLKAMLGLNALNESAALRTAYKRQNSDCKAIADAFDLLEVIEVLGGKTWQVTSVLKTDIERPLPAGASVSTSLRVPVLEAILGY